MQQATSRETLDYASKKLESV
jgi:hypothetical protein